MKVTKEFMQALFPNNSKAIGFIDGINWACNKYNINTPERVCAFIAQIAHESGNFVFVREIWGPTKAQLKYEGRADLGNTVAGDGKKYLGRGLIQITGRNNYTMLSRALGVDLVSNPKLLETERYAVESAAWFWGKNGLNNLADAGDFTGVTKRINGGLSGLSDRMDIWIRAKRIAGIK